MFESGVIGRGSIERYTLLNILTRIRRKGCETDLTYGYLSGLANASRGLCAISRLAFRRTTTPGHPGPFSPSLDKIEPQLGYKRGNVRFVLNALNDMKGTGTDADIATICRAVMENSDFQPLH